jgi:hypothetical protein
MKSDWSFPRQIAVALVVLVVIASYPLLSTASATIIEAVVAGGILATVNVLLGYAAIQYAFGKSTTTFFKVVLGGMGIRLLLLATALVVLIRILGLHAGALVGSMGVCYVVFLTLEVMFIQKKISTKQQS